jgi:hypothetical protein
MLETSALTSGITRIAHGGLYSAGVSAFLRMQNMEELEHAVRDWSSVFSVMSVIVDRGSPLHRDSGTVPSAYDLLVTIGGDEDIAMSWPGLGVKVSYSTGTAVLFSGYVLAHGVPASNSERLCFAYYMKDNVHERFSVKTPPWSELSHYGPL